MCNHSEVSQATSSDWESVCADCGSVVMPSKWKRQPYSDRYRLTSGKWEIVAVACGHDARRSYYIVKQNGKTVDECETLREAKNLVEVSQ